MSVSVVQINHIGSLIFKQISLSSLISTKYFPNQLPHQLVKMFRLTQRNLASKKPIYQVNVYIFTGAALEVCCFAMMDFAANLLEMFFPRQEKETV